MVTGMREVPDDVFRSCEKARVGEVLQDEQRAAAALIFWAALITLLRSLLSAFELPAHYTGMLYQIECSLWQAQRTSPAASAGCSF